jgi:hypothetical protein
MIKKIQSYFKQNKRASSILMGVVALIGIILLVSSIVSTVNQNTDPGNKIEGKTTKEKENPIPDNSKDKPEEKDNEAIRDSHEPPTDIQLDTFQNKKDLKGAPSGNKNPEVLAYNHPNVLFKTHQNAISLYNVESEELIILDKGVDYATISDDNKYVIFNNNGIDGKLFVFNIETQEKDLFKTIQNAKIEGLAMANGQVALLWKKRDSDTYNLMTDLYFDYREGKKPSEMTEYEIKDVGNLVVQSGNHVYYTKDKMVYEIRPSLGNKEIEKVKGQPTDFIVNNDKVSYIYNGDVFIDGKSQGFRMAEKLFNGEDGIYVHQGTGFFLAKEPEKPYSSDLLNVMMQESENKLVYISSNGSIPSLVTIN